MNRLLLLLLLFATLGCPRSEPKGADKRDADVPVALPPPKWSPPSHPVEPEGKGIGEKPKF